MTIIVIWCYIYKKKMKLITETHKYPAVGTTPI